MCDPSKTTEKTRKRKLKRISVYAEAVYIMKPKTSKNISVKLRRTDPNKTYIFKLLPLLNAEREIFTSVLNALFFLFLFLIIKCIQFKTMTLF
jgi:hypothetical protein